MSSEESVYNLVTKLCEHHLAKNSKCVRINDVKRLRAKAFKVLLHQPNPVSDAFWLPNCNCLESQFLTWQYNVQFTFKQPEQAKKIQSYYDTISNSSWDDLTSKAILHFLLKLRKIPLKPKNEIAPRLYESGYRVYNESDFHLEPIENTSIKFSNCSLGDTSRWSDLFIDADILDNSTSNNSDEGFDNRASPEPNIWDVVSRMKYTKRRTWESLGNPLPPSEKPFLSDSSFNVYALMDKGNCLKKCVNKPVTVITKEQYMRDLKQVALGLESHTFESSEDGFSLKPNVVFDKISYDVFKKYSCLMINCGICFKALQNMVSSTETSAFGNVYKYGPIYAEFCSAVNRYLSYYYTATTKFDENKGLLKFHAFIRMLSQQLFAVANICKVGTYREPHGSTIPSGVDLLNYLYKKLFGQSNRTILMVLLGLLFPCLQIYFIRYLSPWLLQGVVNDTHNEFFIRVSLKFLTSKDRKYWTHGFTIVDSKIPEFLIDHAKNILDCGKSAHLLKLCMPKSRIVQYFMANKSHMIQCCITRDLLLKRERAIKAYEFEMVVAGGGTQFSLKDWLAMKEDEKIIFSKCVAAKRAATIKRIQQQRLEKLSKENERKQERYRMLRDEYDKQLALKQEVKLAELARELKEEEKFAAMQEKVQTMIQEEALRMIAHYEQIYENATHMNERILTHIETIKNIHLEEPPTPNPPIPATQTVETIDVDVINANADGNINTDQKTIPDDKIILTDAQRNKLKVMGSSINEKTNILKPSNTNIIVTDAQRNKMKVMTEEYGQKTDLEINRDYSMRSKLTFNDNDFLITTNAPNNNNPQDGAENKPQTSKVEGDSVTDNDGNLITANASRLEKYRQERNFKLDVTKTMAEYGYTPYQNTPSFDFLKSDSLFTATASASAGCSFTCTPMYENAGETIHLDYDYPMRVPLADVADIQVLTLDNYIRRSLMLPLEVQMSLLRSDLLKHFIVDQRFLTHLEQLRNYYFLLDGEYCIRMTRDLFKSLYAGGERAVYGFPARTQSFMADLPEDGDIVMRLCVNSLAKGLDLGNINAFDGISLSCDVKWPLNILLPRDTMGKYDEIFKFLLKVHRVAWVLRNIFMDLKMMHKEHSQHAALLSCSPHYQRVELCRHIMTHFIQTFQNYIVGEVLQSAWASFQEALKSIDHIDDLYTAHTTYVKQIYFMCLLNKQSAPVRKVVMNIFKVILKFYDYLRLRDWVLNDTAFEHPNYAKLEEIFANFMVMAKYFFKVGKKVTRSAYQSQFAQLIDLLDINGYFSACFSEST